MRTSTNAAIRWVTGFAVMAVALASGAGTLSAQSVSAADGLGTTLDALDARSRSLGSVGIGLRGDRLVPTDPAAMADLLIPSVSFSSQTSWVDVDEGGETGSFTGTRFPVVGVAYPVPRLGVFSLSFGTILDQEWQVAQTSEVSLGGTGSVARVTDDFSSEGGVAAVRIGYARRIDRTFTVGATLGRYTGDLSRVFVRRFDSIDSEAPVPSFSVGGKWRYGGTTASVGGTADLGEILHLAGSYSFGGTLEANPTDDTEGGPGSFSMPDELRIGGSALLAPELSLNAGLVRADWTDAGAAYDEVAGFSTTTWGAGLEFTGANLLGKPGALRVGYRSGGLPFAPLGSEDPSESRLTAGIGLDLFQSGPVVIAATDLAVERGSRTIGSVSEEFWRFALTVRVSGN